MIDPCPQVWHIYDPTDGLASLDNLVDNGGSLASRIERPRERASKVDDATEPRSERKRALCKQAVIFRIDPDHRNADNLRKRSPTEDRCDLVQLCWRVQIGSLVDIFDRGQQHLAVTAPANSADQSAYLGNLVRTKRLWQEHRTRQLGHGADCRYWVLP